MDGNIAVIGCGHWGQNLVRNFVSLLGAERVVCCDKSSAVRNEMTARHPAVQTADDPAAVWRDDAVQAVVVATPVPTHRAFAEQAIAAGKHVLVEKPLATNEADASALCQAAGSAGVTLMVDHLLLFHPAFEELGRLCDGGELGDLYHVYSRRTNLGVVRTAENALWSLGPHDIAVMLRLFGTAPVRVTARGGAFLQPERRIHDTVIVTLDFPDGRLGQLHLSWLDPRKLREVTVVGSDGMAIFDELADGAQLRLFDRTASVSGGVASVRDGGERVVPVDDEEPLLRVCRRFLDCVDGVAANTSDGPLGLEVVRVLEAAQRSLDTEGATA